MTKYAFSYNKIMKNLIYDNKTLLHFFGTMIDSGKALDSTLIREILKTVISDDKYNFLLQKIYLEIIIKLKILVRF